MKLGILTQPLLNNYGGILQAFALQQKLKDLGHNPFIINRMYPKPGVKAKFKTAVKNIFYRYISTTKVVQLPLDGKEYNRIYSRICDFKSKYIFPITNEIYDTDSMIKLKSFGFKAFVVGSDQVWRQAYSPCITNYFLDFALSFKDVKKISYAASFGTSNWDVDKNKTKLISKLAGNFNAISVREASGINLCKEYLNVDAIQVLDPTMLLDVKVYKQLILKEGEQTSDGSLMSYFLDDSKIKSNYIEELSQKINLVHFSILPKTRSGKRARQTIKEEVFPSVTKWLKGFCDAEFIITDSFHGCVFSILFNKPFIAVGNTKRGVARFESLLDKFDLKERLILDFEKINYDLSIKKIDWDKVNLILEKEREESIKFLSDNLK
ncbi:polysaccharide pyruvyl transferase family protein [Flavobacterium sp. LAR06]|uniref:polysaccharide pyruvyl transferase family protein n=1 Tax=Flavobacterium sp. LAR06 TaxID=3064897 RepID=UPI0035C1DDF3